MRKSYFITVSIAIFLALTVSVVVEAAEAEYYCSRYGCIISHKYFVVRKKNLLNFSL